MIGQSIENYRIEELLGQGGMGAVYRATDTSLDRSVALKIMNPGVATNADFLRRFKSEARVLGRLQHPNIVNVYTFRHVDSHLIIVMEYVGGGTLSELIDHHGAIPVPESINLLKQSLNALDFAHSSNIIHRDIKPPNILLTREHQVKVSDFGLAKIQEDSNATMVTRVGMTGGTLHYMPPEQTEALSNVDHRGDLYSLGMTFYQMLAGRVPFDRNSSAFSILRAIDQQKIPTPDSFNANIPQGLVEIVMKSIKKYPDDRYQSAEQMQLAIEQFESGFGSPQSNQGEYVKTQILSKPPTFGGGSRTKSSKHPFQKSQKGSNTKERFAVGSRSSSNVKKEKKASRVSKAGKPVADSASSAPSKRLPVILGVGVLLIAGFFIVPRFFGASTNTNENPSTGTENVDTPLNTGGEISPTQNESPSEGDANEETDDPVVAEGGEQMVVENNPDNTVTPPSNSSENTTAQGRSVVVRSNPSGAAVLMNGRNVGQTPLTLDNIQPEVQSFQFRLEGYETANLSLDVSRQTRLDASLVALSGQIRIRVHPFGDIFVNGEQKATQSNRVYQDELRVGSHTILARHPVLGIWEREVTVRAGEEEEVYFNFAQEFSLVVASLPPSATIYVDNEPLMTDTGPVITPKLIQLPPGNHTITVHLQGFKVLNGPMEIVLEEDIEEPLLFNLESE